MRLFWLAVLWAVAFAEPDSEYFKIKQILRSWDPEANYHLEHFDAIRPQELQPETDHIRSKRSVVVSGNSESGRCRTPGYTGPGCRYPICSVQNPQPEDNPQMDGEGATIDSAILSNCSAKYMIYVDETMKNIRIELETDGAINPLFWITDEDGGVFMPSSVKELPDQYNAFFEQLNAGSYIVVPSADVKTHFCQLTVRAHTSLNVGGGFVNSEGNQPERSDFPVRGLVYKDQNAVGIFHGNGLKLPASLDTISFSGGNNNAYRVYDLNHRYNCSYEYVYESFLCRYTGDFLYYIQGTTYQGNTFRRVYPYTCAVAAPTDAPSTTTPAPITGCLHDGLLITNLDGSSYCFCDDKWTGPNCNKIVCFNGGTVSDLNECFCPSQFEGEHCEHMFCDANQGFEFDAEHPTLTFVIRTSVQTRDLISAVANSIQSVVNSLVFDDGYLSSFITVLFNNQSIILNERYTKYEDLIQELQFRSHNDYVEEKCTDIVFESISTALNLLPNYKSPVYVITDALPSDIDYAMESFFQSALYRAPVHFVMVQPQPLCRFQSDSSAYIKMGEMAARTTGEIFYLDNRNNLENFLTTHMNNNLYKSQLMYKFDFPTCAGQLPYQTVAVDSSTLDLLTIIGIGKNLKLNVTAPEGYDLSASIVTAYQDGTNNIWTINGLQTGNFFFRVTSDDDSTPCSLKIYQQSYKQKPSSAQHDIFYAFTEAIHVDGFYLEPLIGVTQSVAFHITEFPFVPEEFIRSALEVYAVRDGVQQQVYASSGFYRDGCSYHFYFPDFHCQVPNEIMNFNFFVTGSRGLAIQRAGTFTCTLIQPTNKPPGSCLNGGIPNAQNSSCYCPMGYTGTHCEQLVCFNGGTPTGQMCKCIAGYAGTFCEFVACTAQGASPEFELLYVDMIFAVELTQIGFAQVALLNKEFPNLIKDIQRTNPTWIGRYVLVGFNSTWGDVLAVAPGYDPSRVISKLEEVANAYPSDEGCNTQLYRGLDMAVRKGDVQPGSYLQLFMVSNPDFTNQRDWLELYEDVRARNLHLTVFMGVSTRFASDINPSGLFCNATWDTLWPLEAVAFSGVGAIYTSQQASVSEFIKIIPLQYESSMVYTYQSFDCTTEQQIYFPVDTYTQTLQFDVYGQNPQLAVRDINGNSYSVQEVAVDDFSMSSIFEVRKPCDDGWTQYNTFCYYFSADNLNYQRAKKECHSAGGQLADDLNDNTHAFIKSISQFYSFWLGGFNNGTWYWDRPDGIQPLPIQTNDYTYWIHDVPIDDDHRQCMFWSYQHDADNTWDADACSDEKFYLCEKPRYDKNYAPDPDNDADHLPPGKYVLSITTNSSGTIYTPNPMCSVVVRVQSGLQFITGFTNTIVQDWPNKDPIKDSDQNRLMSYVHTKDNEMGTAIVLSATILDAYNNTFYNAVNYQYRLNCDWPWLSQTFACPPGFDDSNELAILHTGEDEFGYLFQRFSYGHCSKATLTCGNGGYKADNGVCVCDEYWQGILCTTPVCVNGGSLSTDGRSCVCPTTYSGFHCEYETCDNDQHSSFLPIAKTMIIVIETTFQNNAAVTDFANNLPTAVSQSASSWFNSFIVIAFDGDEIYMEVADTAYQATEIILKQQYNAKKQGSCSMNIWSIIQYFFNDADTFSLVQYPRSEMFVITSAGVSDGDSVRDRDLHTLADSQIIVHYLYVNSSCGTYPSDGSANSIARLAYTTEGNVAFLDANGIGDFFIKYLPTRFDASTILYPSYPKYQCTSSNPSLITVDFNTSAIYIFVSGEFGNVGAVSPQKHNIKPDIIVSNGITRIYRIIPTADSSPGGVWKISFSTPGNCYVAIYTQGGASTYPLYAVAPPSNPTGSRQDGTKHSPFSGETNVVTAHLKGSEGHHGRLTYAQIVDSTTGAEILSSELYIRQGCSYEYVSDPFTCDSNLLTLFIHGIDETNQAFRRQYTSYCIGNNKPSPATPPVVYSTTSMTLSTTTLSTTSTQAPTTSIPIYDVKADIVFIVDESASAANTYDTLHNFIKTLMAPYNLAFNNTRVAFIPVTGVKNRQVIAYYFGDTNSQSALSNHVDALHQFGKYNQPGQYLQNALDLATRKEFYATGYRTTITNHLIVYVTSTSSFSDNPSTDQIRANKTYGVITVGFGGNLDANSLATIAGDKRCVFATNNVDELNNSIKDSVQQLIFSANSNGGIYC